MKKTALILIEVVGYSCSKCGIDVEEIWNNCPNCGESLAKEGI